MLLARGVRDLIVLGGDGTIGEVVAGCIEHDGHSMTADVSLACIHQGTGGDFVRALGIPHAQAAAVHTAISGRLRPVDIGVARYIDAHTGAPVTRGFVNVANVGMAAEVVTRDSGSWKRIGRRASFTVATIACLVMNRPRRVRVVTDCGFDKQLAIVDIAIANGTFMGGGMAVAPDAQLDDGELDVIVIGAARRWSLLRVFPRIYSGRHVTHPLVDVVRTRRVHVITEDAAMPEGVVLDGELVGHTPAEFAVLPSAIRVRV
ncbi:MAG: uncharacterized protein JWN41_1385 [Thermoleophilia bacterium]|nr:uncharacterized protein [Thermoleophilia bacterium]